MFLEIVLLIVGLVLLILGANWLVDGASSIATRLGVSALTVGLTVVAFGTSTPELVVNILSSASGNSGLAIGNVVGSNSINILLILGVAAVIKPINVQSQTVRIEIPFSLLAAAVLFISANDILLDGTSVSILSRSDAMVLLAFFVIFIYYTFLSSKTDTHPLTAEVKHRRYFISTLMVLGGIGALYLGGWLIVDSATSMAKAIGISDALIGLTVVAVGTSLPELATSIMAAYKGNSDIAIGNVVGSNIFNIFFILGVSGSIKPITFYSASNIDLMVVCLASILLFVFAFAGPGRRIDRREGVAFILIYTIYITYLIVTA